MADESLSFRWSFLTDEIGPGGQGDPTYDDLFEVTIDGISVLRGSVRKPGGISPYADTAPYDSVLYTVSSSGPTDNSEFGSSPGGGRTLFQQVCITIANPGTYTLEFLVADQADTTFDSGLLLDDVQVASACDPRIQLTQSDESVVEAKGGGLVFSSVSNGRVALSGDGASLTFRSNGDYTGDNPNLQDQIWLATRNGAVFDISRITGAVNAEFGDPAISADGQWLAFASSGDLVPPGNADGNLEIYRYDRTAGTTLQLTSTTGCGNGQPHINDGGDRVAFVSDCDLGFGSTGNEIVLWDGTFRGVDTLGCISRDPSLSRADGRYVSFLTDCDGQYPATSNPDGSFEILQWDTQTDVYLEVTDVAPGTLLEGLASSADGAFVSFVSNADLESGQNPAGDFVVFRYDRTTASFLQLVDPDPLALFSSSSIDSSGALVVAERIDLLTGAFDIVLFDATLPGTTFPVAQGSATVSNNFPVVAVANNRPLVPPTLTDCTWSCSASEGSSCAPSGSGSITDLIDLQPGGFADYVLSCGSGSTGAEIVNTATVAGPAGWTDPHSGNNSATALLATVAGRLPASLTVERIGGQVLLQWDASCRSTDADYAVYAGLLGSFASHEPIACTAGGGTSLLHTLPLDDTYYLVAPNNLTFEGSYGLDGNGLERPSSTSACFPQSTAPCP